MGALIPVGQVAARPDGHAGRQQCLTFMLGKEVFAIGILGIKEIIEYGQLTAVPMMPGFVRGVINLRGAVLPVIDLAARFGGKPSDVARRTCIVIIEAETGEEKQDIGVMVDAVNEVLDIPLQDIEPVPAFGAGNRTDFIVGMGKVGDRFVIILNADRMLCMEEMALLSAAEAAAVARSGFGGVNAAGRH